MFPATSPDHLYVFLDQGKNLVREWSNDRGLEMPSRGIRFGHSVLPTVGK
jgi:hypothetical protein